MNVEIEIVKDLPVEQIEKFEDRVVYNVAINTRNTTKSENAYPYRTGLLAREEIKAPIEGNNKEYALMTGVDYAKYVWKMNNVNWTNKQTQPQWYYNVLKQNSSVIINNSVVQALKEIK